MIVETRITTDWDGKGEYTTREGYFITIEQLLQLCREFMLEFVSIKDDELYIKSKLKEMK